MLNTFNPKTVTMEQNNDGRYRCLEHTNITSDGCTMWNAMWNASFTMNAKSNSYIGKPNSEYGPVNSVGFPRRICVHKIYIHRLVHVLGLLLFFFL